MIIDEIMSLEAQCFPPEYRGSKEKIMQRWERYDDMFITENYGDDSIKGFLAYFPVNDYFLAKLKNSSKPLDDNISPEDICPKENATAFFIISLCVDKEYRRQGMATCMLYKLLDHTDLPVYAEVVTEEGKAIAKENDFVKESCNNPYVFVSRH